MSYIGPNGEHIFHEAGELPLRLDRSVQVAVDTSISELRAQGLTGIVESILRSCAASPIVVDIDNAWLEVKDDFGSDVVQFSWNVNSFGSAGVLMHDVEDKVFNSSSGTSTLQTLTQTRPTTLISSQLISTDGLDVVPEEMNASFERWKAAVIEACDAANRTISEHRDEMERKVNEALRSKWALVQQIDVTSKRFDIPLEERRGSGSLMASAPVPLVMKLTKEMEAKSESWALDDALAEHVVDTIQSCGRGFERLHRSGNSLVDAGENVLRDFLLLVLNSNFHIAGQVTGETFIGNGKSDLLLRWRNRDAFVGECKIWRSKKEFKDGIDQLLGYSVWNVSRAALVLFVRTNNASEVIIKTTNLIKEHPRFAGKETVGSSSRFDCDMRNMNDANHVQRLSFVPVVMASESTVQLDEGASTPPAIEMS